jgi:monofunctional biosynthetic peptidoglycan transglycosylase
MSYASRTFLRFFFYYLLSFFVLLVVFLIYLYLSLPDVTVWKNENPTETAYMQYESEKENQAGRKIKIHYQWISLNRVPELMRKSVIVAEDASFWGHEGIDWYEVKESLKKDIEEGEMTRGGSTITQQLARNLYLSPRKKIQRKLEEMLIARKLEKHLRKSRILELYFNVVQWGKDIYGIKTAAASYFNKQPAELELHEMVRLAAALPNPVRLRPDRVNRSILWRSKVVLRRLFKYKFISETRYRATLQQLEFLNQVQQNPSASFPDIFP